MEGSASSKYARSDEEKLARLNDTGVRVAAGRLVNIFEEPTDVGRPIEPGPRRKTHRDFTPEDDATLFALLGAAEKEDLQRGNKIFQQLEALRPNHSWQAYENRFRKNKTMSGEQIDEQQPWSGPWPGLYDDAGGDQTHSPPPRPTGRSTTAPTDRTDSTRGYSSLRADTMRNIYARLAVENEEALRDLLRDDDIAGHVHEYRRDHLLHAQAHDASRVAGDVAVGKSVAGRSQHEWKTSYVRAELRKPQSRFATAAVDKSSWTADDHDARFMVQVCRGAMAGKGPWGFLGGRITATSCANERSG
ncbi:hypothetical protein AYL99_05172 [Fonsecaea erecta]|uniref:TERF2-interacting telomeric protein 1 Myb domain-containing protein n=1 Tax=Fonsecaea erecta TaxID=1367422 RepID=A0A178ZK47_9EURO|nr:hypothetical protein AYL99_05172 [Fonsecaea erecta]OAP60170.1 hypothetical protein AYL99_05172 [Fonsecaea erecta]